MDNEKQDILDDIEEFLKGEKELTTAVVNEELGRIKLIIGWLTVISNDCFERNYLFTLLKKRYDKLLEKKGE